MDPTKRRRRFLIEIEGDFDPATHPSDIALLVDQAFDYVPNLKDFSGDKGALVHELILPENYR
jgi:hypothetical protein